MLPLHGIRVVSIAQNVPGPLAVAKLRAAGASVIKIEPPAGDPLEGFCPSWYEELHRDTVVERLDLKSGAGDDRMQSLLADADLFVASQRPAALTRLRLDVATLLASHRATVHLRWLNIVGERAHPEVAGHDLTYLARAGLLGSEVPRTLIADVLGAEAAYARALLLLREAPGSSAEVGLYDSLAPLIAARTYGLTGPGTLLGGAYSGYAIYRAREGRVAVAALEPHFRAQLFGELGQPDGADLTAVFAARSAAEWQAWARQRDLPLTAVAD